jgi:hypothetical protein
LLIQYKLDFFVSSAQHEAKYMQSKLYAFLAYTIQAICGALCSAGFLAFLIVYGPVFP